MNRIVTPQELHGRSTSELSALFRKVSQDLTASRPGTADRRNALASLKNIQRAQATRKATPLKPPGF